MNVAYHIYNFEQLSKSLLYDILALRAEVFIVEQASPYLDLDGLDQECIHLCMMHQDKLVGYARLVPPELKFPEASVGRIVLADKYRGKGAGRELVQRSIAEVSRMYGQPAIRIEAQHHLRDFYGSLGFTIVSDIYDWGGIPHVKMVGTP